MEKVGSGLKGKSVTTKCEVRISAAGHEIIKLADEINADMVAISTHGRSGVERWVFGSVAEKVVRSGNTPVLLVRIPGAGSGWCSGGKNTAEEMMYRSTWLEPWMIPRDSYPATSCSPIPRGMGYILLPHFFLRRHVLPFH